MIGRPQRPRLAPDEAREIQRLGANLRIARMAAGLSQRALGRLTNTNPTYISNVEKGGVAGISVLKVSILAKALGLTGSQLMGNLPTDTRRKADEEEARRELNRQRHADYLRRKAIKDEEEVSAAPASGKAPKRKRRSNKK